MKKSLLAVSLILGACSLKAQDAYVNVGVGYGFGYPNEVLGTETSIDGSGNVTDKNTYGTLGQGLSINVYPGLMLTNHLGLEMGFSYFLGSSITTDEFSMTNANTYSTRKAQSNQFRIIPTLVYSTGKEDMNWYGKFGLVLPVTGKTTVDIENGYTIGGAPFKEEISSETTGSLSLGFRGAFGFEFNLSESLGFFAELNSTNLRIKQDHTSITSYTANGADQLSTAPTYAKEIDYVDELNPSSNNSDYNPNVNTGAAQEQLAQKTNFNSFGIGIGLKIRF